MGLTMSLLVLTPFRIKIAKPICRAGTTGLGYGHVCIQPEVSCVSEASLKYAHIMINYLNILPLYFPTFMQ